MVLALPTVSTEVTVWVVPTGCVNLRTRVVSDHLVEGAAVQGGLLEALQLQTKLAASKILVVSVISVVYSALYPSP